MPIHLTALTCGHMDNRTYLLTDVQSQKTIIVDPGFDPNRILTAMQGKTPEALLLTHAHFDHMNLIDMLRTLWNVPLWVHIADSDALQDGERNVSRLFLGHNQTYKPAEHTFVQQDTIPLENEWITVIHTPGHTPGSCCFFVETKQGPALLTGDTLLHDSIGRTDFAGGSMTQMMQSVQKLKALGKQHGDWMLYPGHGNADTFANQLITNPYLR